MKRKSIMKKLFCVILAVAVFAVSIPFTAIAATTEDVNFVILSDLHYFAESSQGTTAEDKAEFNDMMLMNNATSGIAPEIIDAALDNVAIMAQQGKIDFLLVPGDLTKNAEKAAHQELVQKFTAFEQETNIPIYVINGNHDINNQRAAYYDGEKLVNVKKNPELRSQLDTTPAEFEALYRDFGYSSEGGYYSRYKEIAGNTEGSLSYAIDLPNNYRLIAIDSQLYSADNTDKGLDEQETAGKMSDALLDWALEECAQAKKDGKTVIGFTHTNTVPHFDTEVDLFDNFVFRDWEKAADSLADAGMHYTVSGHVHMQDVATYVSDNGEEITDITGASILSYPNLFRSVSMSSASNGNITCSYKTHDIDEYVPVIIDGVAQPKPFKNIAWAYNFGGSNIKTFATNVIRYQLVYGFGKDVKDAGGLYYYLEKTIGLKTLISDLADSEVLGALGEGAIRALLFSLCNQLDKAYLKNPDKTIEILDPMLDKLLNIEVSDYPCTAFKNTLGFGSDNAKGTLGDLASTVLAYHYTNNEDPNNDKFLQSALTRFNNGENAEVIVDTLLDVVLNDLLQNTILEDIKIDPISFGINSEASVVLSSLTDILDNLVRVNTENLPSFGLSDIVSAILLTGILGNSNKLSGAVYSILDEYLTKSQYDVIDGEFYRILKDLTHDENPGYMADFDGTVSYNGKVSVPLSQDNLRLPSHIAVTLGEDASTSRNISYFTKYSITNTDIQIVPYSNNPDFSNGTTVNATIDTNCEIDAQREYYAIDLSFIGIITHKMTANRHTINISGLEAGQKYCYRIGDASRNWWSDVGVIDTADNSDSFSFFHMTDPQSVTEKQYADNWANTLETAFANHSDAGFILTTGDHVDNGGDFVEWKRMFNSATEILMSTSLMGASGNHEERGDNALVNNFVYSNLPEQDTTAGVYYSFDYNNAHIAVLNSNDLNEDGGLSDAQIQWLTDDMNASDKTWKFVAIHKAPYSNGSHFDDDDVSAIRDQFMTLMPELDVDIVFQGHDHVYMRTDVMNDNEVVGAETKTLKYNGLKYNAKLNPDGTIYSINGTAGSKHYEPKADSETKRTFPTGEAVVSLDIPSYSYIQIDGDNLYFDSYAVDADGEERIDNFAISKAVADEDDDNQSGTNPGGNGTNPGGDNGTIDNNNNDKDNNKDNNKEDNKKPDKNNNKKPNKENDKDGNGVNDKIDEVIDDITDTFRQNPVLSYVTVSVVALGIIAVVVTTFIVAKRKREEA
ncbi:MAG: metallophosphoesterase [Clostridia bacterium]|nr:metallophosphoesterase [Clostridia bacterium]